MKVGSSLEEVKGATTPDWQRKRFDDDDPILAFSNVKSNLTNLGT
jgi:hypothetical protein